MSDFKLTKIECAENEGDHLFFAYDPNCDDGKPAGIDMSVSSDGSISLDYEQLVKLRDACNEAIAAQG